MNQRSLKPLGLKLTGRLPVPVQGPPLLSLWVTLSGARGPFLSGSGGGPARITPRRGVFTASTGGLNAALPVQRPTGGSAAPGLPPKPTEPSLGGASQVLSPTILTCHVGVQRGVKSSRGSREFLWGRVRRAVRTTPLDRAGAKPPASSRLAPTSRPRSLSLSA